MCQICSSASTRSPTSQWRGRRGHAGGLPCLPAIQYAAQGACWQLAASQVIQRCAPAAAAVHKVDTVPAQSPAAQMMWVPAAGGYRCPPPGPPGGLAPPAPAGTPAFAAPARPLSEGCCSTDAATCKLNHVGQSPQWMQWHCAALGSPTRCVSHTCRVWAVRHMQCWGVACSKHACGKEMQHLKDPRKVTCS